jgi:prepilin-type N-terminal cleavage/methylation domain-containing protein/prepilin-type processing-associated H-X9-DG protein
MANSLTKENMSCLLNRKIRAFTLIELLVVIAIIGLLMSVLLPSLTIAKAQTRSLICKTNLHQLALANIAYSTENDEYFVAAASDHWAADGGLNRWHGVRETSSDAFDPTQGPLASYMGDGKVKECPENVKFHKGASLNESFEKGCGGYGYNLTYIGSTQWHTGIASIAEWKKCYAETTKSIQVARPVKTLMFADTAFLRSGKLIEYSFVTERYWLFNGEPDLSSSPLPTVHFRHRLKANVAWVDGHVDAMDMPKKYDTANAYLEAYRELSLGMVEPLNNSLFDLK